MTEALSYRNQSIDCKANQWTGFYMITASVMKELNTKNLKTLANRVILTLFKMGLFGAGHGWREGKNLQHILQ